MIKPVQNVYNDKFMNKNNKTKNSFGAVNLNNYSPLTLENAFKQDFSKLFPAKPEKTVESVAKDVATRIHASLQNVIETFKGKSDKTLTLAVHPLYTGDKYDGLHVIGASVHKTDTKIPEGPQVLDYLFNAEKTVLPGMQKFIAL